MAAGVLNAELRKSSRAFTTSMQSSIIALTRSSAAGTSTDGRFLQGEPLCAGTSTKAREI
jgi:hypothetical protein